ncbi:MAG: hypothetical protein Q8K82_15840 [Gemmatimonadaceae bacterium]|nr:hypothetical protein [Gemmatimonadaceae bacterium]
MQHRRASSTDVYVTLLAYSAYSGETLTSAPLTQKVVVRAEPAGATANVAFLQQPVVGLTMADASPILLAGVPVSVGLVGFGTIGGTLAVNTDASGVATFTNLRADSDSTHALQCRAVGYGTALSLPWSCRRKTSLQSRKWKPVREA